MWNIISKGLSIGWEFLKKAGPKILEKGISILKSIDWIKEGNTLFSKTLENLSTFEQSNNLPHETVNWNWERGKTENLSSENIKERSKRIGEFQNQIRGKANSLEQSAITSFLGVYETVNILEEMEIDISPINKEVKRRSKEFNNFIRDYVNEKVSLSDNSEFKKICDDTELDGNTHSNKLREYRDNVVEDAKRKILNRLKKSITETNLYINEYVDSQLQSLVDSEEELKNKLENLSSDKETADKELLRTGEIVALTSLIETTANAS
jgi:type III secretory pathway component EscV